MIEFNGLKIDTRSLMLIAGTIVAVVALWPDSNEAPPPASAEKSEKPPVSQYSDRRDSTNQGRTAQSQHSGPWQSQLAPYQPQGYGKAGVYPPGTGTPTPPAGAYSSQSPVYGGPRYPSSPYDAQNPGQGQGMPYGYGGPGAAPYGYSPYPGLRFRPEDKTNSSSKQPSSRGVPPAVTYPPNAPGGTGTAPQEYSPVDQMPWEYAPYDNLYDLAPSGATEDLNHLYTVR